ncbi:MAG TPA: SPOR domain-containing protein, partial [Blastocatellia bacterium]|nr:SPOR domain-containing protein [Blastocatellia bacterium]
FLQSPDASELSAPELPDFAPVFAAEDQPEPVFEPEQGAEPTDFHFDAFAQEDAQAEPLHEYTDLYENDQGENATEAETIEAVAEPPVPPELHPTPVERAEAASFGASYADVEADLSEDAEEQKIPADPWEEPLPAWEYSTHEWPIVVDNRNSSVRRKPWLLLAASVILVAGIAGYYFLFSSPAPSRQAQQDAPASQQAAAIVNPQPVNATQSNTPANAAQPQPAAPQQTAAPVEQASAGEAKQPTHTLQVESTPDRAAADERAEKLKRAGIPAYVVAADLGKRGTWYRVRVGRFSGEEEARRFIEQSRARARAAGMEIQLVVQPYEKN